MKGSDNIKNKIAFLFDWNNLNWTYRNFCLGISFHCDNWTKGKNIHLSSEVKYIYLMFQLGFWSLSIGVAIRKAGVDYKN